jgi:hypothetical protein
MRAEADSLRVGSSAILNGDQLTRLPFAWRRSILWIWPMRRIGGAIVIHQDAMRIAVQVVELAAARGPEQDAHRNQAEDQHAWNETIDDFHWIVWSSFAAVGPRPAVTEHGVDAGGIADDRQRTQGHRNRGHQWRNQRRHRQGNHDDIV